MRRAIVTRVTPTPRFFRQTNCIKPSLTFMVGSSRNTIGGVIRRTREASQPPLAIAGRRLRTPGWTPVIDLARNSAWLLIDIAIVSILTAGALVVLWVVATNLRDCWRAFLWLGAAIRRGRVSPERTANPPPAPVFPSAAHLSLDAQWTRVTGVVASGIGRTRAMERIHGGRALRVGAFGRRVDGPRSARQAGGQGRRDSLASRPLKGP